MLCFVIVFVCTTIWSTNCLLVSEDVKPQFGINKDEALGPVVVAFDFSQNYNWTLERDRSNPFKFPSNESHGDQFDPGRQNWPIQKILEIGNGLLDTSQDNPERSIDQIPPQQLTLTSLSRHDLSTGLFAFGAKTYGLISLGIIALQAIALKAYGQPATCKSGQVRLWHSNVLDDQNSQHLTDWYTFTHVLHGFIFYGILAFVAPNLPIQERFLVALGVEAGWEVLENSPFVIDRYRRTALAQGYKGDSIINSISDTFAMAFGFITSHLLPGWVVVAFAIAEEVFVGIKIRDNLTLNLIQLIHPVKAISTWQQGGGIS